MAVRINARLTFDIGKANQRLKGRIQKAQEVLNNEIIRTSTPFVPMRSGNLRGSAVTSTQLGDSKITWGAPHAAYQYYGQRKNGTRKIKRHSQPNITPPSKWFEKARAANKDAWVKSVEKTIKG